MTLEQKIGQLLISYVYGATADTADARNTDRYGVATPAEVVQKYHLGGVIYFSWADNTDSPEQIAGLSNGLQQAATADARGGRPPVGLLITTDQETGRVVRVGPPATQFPGAMALGASRDTEAGYDTYAITGRELRALGLTGDHAPVADVNVSQQNPVINTRSFGGDPGLVSEMVAAAVGGLQDNGVCATAKHFPGHGDTNQDSHETLPEISHTRQQWEELDAPPFAAAVAAGTDMIMTAHIRFLSLDPSGDPATLSKPILTGLLRERLGFDGVVITDSLGMAGVREMYTDDEIAVRAIEAGVDLLLSPVDFDLARDGLLAAVRSGRISERRIEQSLRRLLGMKWDRGLAGGLTVEVDELDRVIGTEESLQRAEQITDKTTTVLANDRVGGRRLLPLPAGSVLLTGAGASDADTLADELTAAGRTVERLDTGTAPTVAEIEQAVARATDHDLTVLLTNAVRTAPQQADLATALLDAGAAVVVLAVAEPYDIAYLGEDGAVPAYLATYAGEPIAQRSAARVLLGTVQPSGRLPVDIVSAADPDTVVYPYGSGLSL